MIDKPTNPPSDSLYQRVATEGSLCIWSTQTGEGIFGQLPMRETDWNALVPQRIAEGYFYDTELGDSTLLLPPDPYTLDVGYIWSGGVIYLTQATGIQLAPLGNCDSLCN